MKIFKNLWPLLAILVLISPGVINLHTETQEGATSTAKFEKYNFREIANFEKKVQLFSKEISRADSKETYLLATRKGESIPWDLVSDGTAYALVSKTQPSARIIVTSKKPIVEPDSEEIPAEISKNSIKVEGSPKDFMVAYEPHEVDTQPQESLDNRTESNWLLDFWSCKFMPRNPYAFYSLTFLIFLVGSFAHIFPAKSRRVLVRERLASVGIISIFVWYFAVHFVDPLTTDVGLVGCMFLAGLNYTNYMLAERG